MLKKQIQKLNVWDMGLIKLASIAFGFFVITIWPAAMQWVHGVNPWYFLIAAIILALIPQYRVWKK